MEYGQLMQRAAQAIDIAGVAVIAIGLTVASGSYLKKWWRTEGHEPHGAYQRYRAGLGRGILLGLEFMVAAGIIRTVAIELTFTSLGILAILIFVRSFLGITLQMEVEGRLPWRGSGIPETLDEELHPESALTRTFV
jgi:uncharacterized membrane protein